MPEDDEVVHGNAKIRQEQTIGGPLDDREEMAYWHSRSPSYFVWLVSSVAYVAQFRRSLMVLALPRISAD